MTRWRRGSSPDRRSPPGELTRRHRAPREIFPVRDLEVSYSGKSALADVTWTSTERGDGDDRPVGLRQEHVHPLLQPHERPHPRGRGQGRGALPRLRPLRRKVDPVEVRKRIGMVFQKPNPFPKSIYDNVAFGPRVLGRKDNLDGRVERALQQAALWDEVKHRLKASALGLSGGQQQRLCIARCLAVEPDVILMDEPASALDPIATTRIEDLMQELKQSYAIVIVTHNMQQAARVADMTAFFSRRRRGGGRARPASSSSSTAPTRSSRSRPTSAPRTTSPGGSDDGGTSRVVPGGAALPRGRPCRRSPSSCFGRSAAR